MLKTEKKILVGYDLRRSKTTEEFKDIDNVTSLVESKPITVI